MSGLPQKLRLAAVLLFSFYVMNKDGTKDEAAQVGNVDMTLENVTDAQGNPMDPANFATLEEVSEDVDKATITSDPAAEGASGTFVGKATISWPQEDGPPIVKTLEARGTATLTADPSAGDTLVMEVQVLDPTESESGG